MYFKLLININENINMYTCRVCVYKYKMYMHSSQTYSMLTQTCIIIITV